MAVELVAMREARGLRCAAACLLVPLPVKAQTVRSPPPPAVDEWAWLMVMAVAFVCVIYCMLAMLTFDDSSDKYNDPMVPPKGEPLGRRVRRRLGLETGAATPGSTHLGLKLHRSADGVVQRSDL